MGVSATSADSVGTPGGFPGTDGGASGTAGGAPGTVGGASGEVATAASAGTAPHLLLTFFRTLSGMTASGGVAYM